MIIPNVTSQTKQGRVVTDLLSNDFEQNRRIYLNGEIDESQALYIIAQLDFLDRINNNEIFLYINSLGGCVTSGFAIKDAMDRSQSDIVTVCTGMAASMGAFLVACGTKGKRYITPHANMMIHQPLGGARGQASDIILTAKRIEKIKHLINKTLADKTGKKYKTIKKDSDRDFYMNAKEAIKYGLADRMLDINENKRIKNK